MSTLLNTTVSVGDIAPTFALDVINRDGQVSLDDYRGRSGLFLNVVRGLHCPFCRRHLTQLATTDTSLRENGVETLVVVSTSPERASKYLRYRPSPLTIASDPDTDVHRTYGLPKFAVTEDSDDWPRTLSAGSLSTPLPDPTGEHPDPAPIPDTVRKLNEKDRYEPEPGEVEIDISPAGIMLEGRFMIDRDGIVRWIHVEARDGPQNFAETPTPREVLEAARLLH
jgi:peroxiredoxin